MAQSQRLRMDDIRMITRLLREVCELGEDTQRWRTHMLLTLRKLIGAGISSHYLHDLPLAAANLRFKGYMDVGADPLWHQYLARCDVSADPITPGMTRLLGRTFVRSEDQLCTAKEWYSAAVVNEVWRPLKADHEMASIAVMPDGKSFSAIGFGRCLGDPPFGRREREAVHLFHTELIELWRTPVIESGNGTHREQDLSPRLRQTLALLREGLSEKQMAARMNLSRHTIHDYVKELFRRFDAHSATELLAHTRTVRGFRPALEFTRDYPASANASLA